MILIYASKLGLTPETTIINAEKIDNLALKTHKMVTAEFLVYNTLEQARFFEKTFLLTDTSIEMVLEYCSHLLVM